MLSKELVIFSIKLTIAMLVDLPVRKPKWQTDKTLFLQINFKKLSSNNFSRILENYGSTKIGLQLLNSSFAPVLYIGITLAIFIATRKIPVANERLHIYVNGCTTK